MNIRFLGTGNSAGIPAFGCTCAVCSEARINLERRRKSICQIIEADGRQLVIDAGVFQLARFLPPYDTAILLSHFHPGHIYGCQALRGGNNVVVDVYGPPDHRAQERLQRTARLLKFHDLSGYEQFELHGFTITPVPLNHSVITLGFCIERGDHRVAYLCDTCGLPNDTRNFLERWRPTALIIDCNQPPDQPHTAHNTPHQAFEIHFQAGATESWLTHIGCGVDAWLRANRGHLPDGVSAAWDGLLAPVRPSITEPSISQ